MITANPAKSNAEPVYWDGIELRKGQIGRLTITKSINLWKRTADGLQFERTLYPGERYRVYRRDSKYGGQFGVGGNFYITNMPSHVYYETPSKSKKELLDCNQQCLVDKFIILPEEPYDNTEVTNIKHRLSVVPGTLLGRIIQHNIKVILTNDVITEVPEFSYLRDVTPRGWEGTNKTWDDVPGIGGTHQVVIRIGYSEKGKGHDSTNLELHELAHSIDQIIMSNLSETDKFRKIWQSEKNSIFPELEYYDFPEEYFAEVFAMYFIGGTQREQLKQKAPKTYEYIRNIKW